MGSLRDRLQPPEEQAPLPTKAVATVSRTATVTQRANEVREQLASLRGGFDEARQVALLQMGVWPEDLRTAAMRGGPEGQAAERTAALIVMQAAELGVSGLQAFSYITAIKGKPFIMARMVSALVASRVAGAYISITDRSPLAVSGMAHRPGRPDVRVTLTIDDAKRAGWMDKNPNYAKVPAAMLTARVTTTLGWLQFADVLAGMDVYSEDTGEQMLAAEVETVPSTAFQQDAAPTHPDTVDGEARDLEPPGDGELAPQKTVLRDEEPPAPVPPAPAPPSEESSAATPSDDPEGGWETGEENGDPTKQPCAICNEPVGADLAYDDDGRPLCRLDAWYPFVAYKHAIVEGLRVKLGRPPDNAAAGAMRRLYEVQGASVNEVVEAVRRKYIVVNQIIEDVAAALAG